MKGETMRARSLKIGDTLRTVCGEFPVKSLEVKDEWLYITTGAHDHIITRVHLDEEIEAWVRPPNDEEFDLERKVDELENRLFIVKCKLKELRGF
jgi:hypothetical protein